MSGSSLFQTSQSAILNSDAEGLPCVTGPLPPGKYLVLASGGPLDWTAESILRFWNARSKAKEVEIGPNATVQVSVEPVDTR